jgi:hypothetical protein
MHDKILQNLETKEMTPYGVRREAKRHAALPFE